MPRLALHLTRASVSRARCPRPGQVTAERIEQVAAMKMDPPLPARPGDRPLGQSPRLRRYVRKRPGAARSGSGPGRIVVGMVGVDGAQGFEGVLDRGAPG
jgi:hypothetical protein